MKRVIISILIAALIIFACAAGVIFFGSKQLDIFAEIPPGAEKESFVFSGEGIAEVLKEEKIDENTLKITIGGISDGRTDATLTWNGADESLGYSSELSYPITVKNGILYEEITGNFSGWKTAALCVGLFLIASAVILFAAFYSALKTDMYSYSTIRYLGFAIFIALLGIMRLRFLNDMMLNGGNGTVWSMLVGVSVSAQRFVLYTSPIILLFALAMVISNVDLIRHEGFYPTNLLAFLIGILMAGGAAVSIGLAYSRLVFGLRNLVTNIYSGVFCYFECLLFATIACGIISARHIPKYNKDYVLVLGCRIREDGSLFPIVRSRVDKAIEFAEKQFEKTGKHVVLVPSGGKGTDEVLPEARAMEKYMLAHGVPEEYILAEDKSATTRENMRFSKAIIEKKNPEAMVAFSTSNFHVFRSGILAKEENWKLEGMGSPTKWYFWPNAFIREFVALFADSWGQQIVILSAICLVSYLLTLIL